MAANVYVPLQPNLEELAVPRDPMSALNQVMQASMQAHAQGVADMSNLLDEIQVKPAQRKQAAAEANKRVADINELSAPQRATAFKTLQAENARLASQIQLLPQATEAQREALNANIATTRLQGAQANQAFGGVQQTQEEQITHDNMLALKKIVESVRGPGAQLPTTTGGLDQLVDEVAARSGRSQLVSSYASYGLPTPPITGQDSTGPVVEESDPDEVDLNAAKTLARISLLRDPAQAEKYQSQVSDLRKEVKADKDVDEFNTISDQFHNIKDYYSQAKMHAGLAGEDAKEAETTKIADLDMLDHLRQMVNAKLVVKGNQIDRTDPVGIVERVEKFYSQTFRNQLMTPAERKSIMDEAERLYYGGLRAATPVLKQYDDVAARLPAVLLKMGGSTKDSVLTSKHADWLDQARKQGFIVPKKGATAAALNSSAARPAPPAATSQAPRRIPGWPGLWMLDPANPGQVIPYAAPGPVQNAPPAPMIQALQ